MMELQHLDRFDSLNLKGRGVYEPWETGIIKSQVKSGDWFIDVGAHVDYYTVMAAELVGPTGKVLAFEPAPENYAVLMKNIAGLENVEAYREAVSSCNGPAYFYINPKNSGDNRLTCPGPNDRRIEVGTLRLDDALSPELYPRVKWLKIDTQGHELSVLAGADGILQASPDIRLIVEYEPVLMDLNGIQPGLMLETLRGYGFTFRSSKTHDYRKCTVASRRHCNLFCERCGGLR